MMYPVAEPNVRDFAHWWLTHKPIQCPGGAISRIGKISGITLYRNGQFQVQMFIGEPLSSAPKHSHPNIDSVEVVLSGELILDEAGTAIKPGDVVPVAPGEFHVARAPKEGVCFLSIQKWLNGVNPTSVVDDWDGKPIDDNHAEALRGINA